jgi:hypothetical protein
LINTIFKFLIFKKYLNRRSKSPGGTTKPPDEILQHIKYDLIQTSGLSSDQLREIPFVKVE